ncbi:MAG: gyrase subunit, partial [Actinomycetota bacterium]|nr:gyrase subunit [Actinomycetota bacterium]
GRGGQGVRGMRVTEARGHVVAAFTVESGTELLVFSSAGNIVRMGVDEISEQGRDATGVRVARLDEGDTVVAVAKVLEAESDESSIEGTAAVDASSDGAGGLEGAPNAETVVLDEPGSASEGEEN